MHQVINFLRQSEESAKFRPDCLPGFTRYQDSCIQEGEKPIDLMRRPESMGDEEYEALLAQAASILGEDKEKLRAVIQGKARFDGAD